MSAIAGILYFDGKIVDKNILEKVIDSEPMLRRGPDSKGIWFNGSVGLAQRGFWTTYEQELERQPLEDKSAGLTLVMDGRIDNRSELIEQLKAKGVNKPLATDAEIVLQAYCIWGEECPIKLIGDFSFVIWDKNKQRLFCVRDALGIRPFYYYKNEKFIAFASDATALFQFPEVQKEPDLNSMVLYLMNNFESSEHTECKNILRLRPGHFLIVENNSFKIKQYWDIDPNHFLVLNKFEDYIEAFLEIFTKAVLSQLRTNCSLGITLSGGLDSSSVLSLIEELKLQGKISPDITAYSVAFDSEPADESPYIRSFQEKWGTKISWVQSQQPQPLWEVPDAINTSQPLWSVEASMLTKPLYMTARNDGRKVLLTGEGGDDYMDVSVCLSSDLLMSGHPIQAANFLKAYAKFQLGSLPFLTWTILLAPLQSFRMSLPLWLKRFYRKIRPIKSYDWICQPYKDKAVDIIRQKPWYLNNHKFKTISRKETYSSLHNGYRISGYEMLDRLASSANAIEIRHPFADRRLVEFACSIPEKILVYDGRPKGFLRAAMKSKLPDMITNRMDKGDYTSLINKLLICTNNQAIKNMLDSSYLDQIGLIDKKKAIVFYDDYCSKYANSLDDSTGSDIMWQLLSLEYWARNTFGRIETYGGVNHGKRKILV